MKFFIGGLRLRFSRLWEMSYVASAAACALAVMASAGFAQSVFYIADQRQYVHELYHWDCIAETGSKLSGPLVPGGKVHRVISDEKGKIALYLADAEIQGQRELFAVDVSSQLVQKVNEPLAYRHDVHDFQISRHGKDAFYLVGEECPPYRLFHRDLTTSSIRELKPDSGTDGGVLRFAVSPKGDTVAFIHRGEDTAYELYLTHLKSGTLKKVNLPLPEMTDIENLRFDDIGNNLFYTTVKISPPLGIVTGSLFHHNIKNSMTTELPGTTRGGHIQEFSVSPKGKAVAYVVKDDYEESAVLHHVYLKTSKLATLAGLSTSWGVPGDRIWGIHSCKVAPTGKQVAYTMGDIGDLGVLNLTLFDLRSAEYSNLTDFTERGSRVWDVAGDRQWKSLFCLASDANDVQELHRIDLKTKEQVQLSKELAEDADVNSAFIDLKGKFAVYEWRSDVFSPQLKFVDVKTGENRFLNPHGSPDTSIKDYYVPGCVEIMRK